MKNDELKEKIEEMKVHEQEHADFLIKKLEKET